MKKYDAHLHIGDYIRCKKILSESEYKEKYKLYKEINLRLVEYQCNYLKELDNFFAIPIIFKEINIDLENIYVSCFCQQFGKGIPVSIITNNFNVDTKFQIWKEHFLIHDYNLWEERKKIYQYINDIRGYLIIHCKDKIRLEYLKLLSESFPQINFIVAHLGRDVNENKDFIRLILQTFNTNNFYFDLSTIKNIDNIILASTIVDKKHILYGSDYPYISLEEIHALKRKIFDLDNADYILEKNFDTLARKIVKN